MEQKIENRDLITQSDGSKKLPELAVGITNLNLYYCHDITFLPENLPASLKHLSLSECVSFKSLPENLPASLTHLSLFGCTSLQKTEKLLQNLLALEERPCTVYYPEHFNLDPISVEAKETLEKAIEAYKNKNPDQSIPTPREIKTLLHRFLTKSVGQRGSEQAKNSKECLRELVETVNPVLDAFTENPDYLKWAEKVAEIFLDGCVNQPVAGWSEISALASVAKAPDLTGKIKATEHLRVLGAIVEYIKHQVLCWKWKLAMLYLEKFTKNFSKIKTLNSLGLQFLIPLLMREQSKIG